MNKHYFIESSRRIKAYTDTLVGMFILYAYHNLENKHFYVRKEICDCFKNSAFSKFLPIENNKKYVAYSKVNPNITLPNHLGYSKNEYDLFLKMFSIENYNDLFQNFNSKSNVINTLIDHQADRLYEKLFYDKHKIKYTNTRKILKQLKTNISIDKNKVKQFDKNHAFISLPTWKLENKQDIQINSDIINFIIKKTPYKNLILISGDNFHKTFFTGTYGLKTTEFYTQHDTRVFSKNNKIITKSKGGIEGLIKDYLYIQESEAPYLDFSGLLNKYNYNFEKHGLISTKLNRLHTIDIGAMLVKENKILSYET